MLFTYTFVSEVQPDLDFLTTEIKEKVGLKVVSCCWKENSIFVSFEEKLDEEKENELRSCVLSTPPFEEKRRLPFCCNFFDLITWFSKEAFNYNIDQASNHEVLGHLLSLSSTKSCWISSKSPFSAFQEGKKVQINFPLLYVDPLEQEVKVCFTERVEEFPLETIPQVGWKVVNGSVFCISSDGVRQSEIDCKRTFSGTKLMLEIFFTRKVVMFFINGFFVAEVSDVIPQVDSMFFYASTRSLLQETLVKCQIGRVLILQDIET